MLWLTWIHVSKRVPEKFRVYISLTLLCSYLLALYAMLRSVFIIKSLQINQVGPFYIVLASFQQVNLCCSGVSLGTQNRSETIAHFFQTKLLIDQSLMPGVIIYDTEHQMTILNSTMTSHGSSFPSWCVFTISWLYWTQKVTTLTNLLCFEYSSMRQPLNFKSLSAI